MTANCPDKVRIDCTDRKLHDAVYTVVIAFIFVIPATLAALTLV